mmetsp:Transcript_82565/g.114670  ORF Transcript_82565/g.114670 Transcript_82565/m.114670 type:complete len:159 (-) Transcript_82565:746-1222(-)
MNSTVRTVRPKLNTVPSYKNMNTSSNVNTPRASKKSKSAEALENASNVKSEGRIIDNITVTSILNQSRFTVYKAASKSNSAEQFALKVFPYVDGQPNIAYINEVRFMDLKHPNIVNIVDANPKQKVKQDGQLAYASYLLMEYAPYGDLATYCEKVPLG